MPPKGKTNNPAGRPRKGMALSDLLRRQLGKTYLTLGGTKVAARRIITTAIVDAIISGKWKMADGTFVILTYPEIVDLIKFVFLRVDGQPPAAVDVTSGGEVINVTLVKNNDD